MTVRRTTSAVPVSHVFKGQRPLLVEHPNGSITPVRASRKAYTPSVCQTPCAMHPDCVCASCAVLEGG